MRRAVSLGLGLALLGLAPPALAHAELLRAMPQHVRDDACECAGSGSRLPAQESGIISKRGWG